MLFFLPLAAAADTWSAPQPGVTLLERAETGQRVFAAYVDLCEPGTHPRATTYDERGQKTSSWASDVGATVAINGAFFSYDDYDAIGWSIGDGQTWPTAVDYDHYTAIAFDEWAQAEIFDADVPLPPDDFAWREMVPGDPLLVDDGVVVQEDCYSHFCDRHPRTAVGLTEDEQTVLLVVVDGRSDVADGMTRLELADLMVELGAHRAMNLDGGGSSTLWIDGLGVVNEPSDGSERVVSSHLGFQAVASEAPCCVHAEVAGATGIFADVADTSWVKPYAEALYQAGITSGCDQDPLLFCPDCVLDRGTLAVLIARGLGLPDAPPVTFSDVDPDDWRAPAIEALYQAGITSGCGGGEFCPDRLATRWETAAFVFRGMGIPEATPTGRFSDVSAEQAPVVEALADACVVSGCDADAFCPDEEVTRGQVAKLVAVGFGIGGFGPCLGEDTGDTGVGDTAADTGTSPGDTATDDTADVPPAGEVVDAEAEKRPASCGCAAGTDGGAPLGLVLAWGAAIAAGRRARRL